MAAPSVVARQEVGLWTAVALDNTEGNGGGSGGGDSGAWWWLPSVPAPSLGVSSTRPAGLFEGRAVFGAGAGRVARECSPVAAKLLGALGAEGAVAEHM